MKYDDDIEDLLGPSGAAPTKRNKYRPRIPKPTHSFRSLAGPVLKASLPVVGQMEQPATEVMGGVTVFWLAKAFGIEVSTARKKLADCPTVGRKTSGHLYSLPVAAAYLVRPRLDVSTYMAQMKPHELPTQLQPTYWDGVLKRQKFEIAAKHLWLSEDVMEVFAEVFKSIKFTLQLWPDMMERQGNFSDEQRAALTEMVDQLADDIHRAVTDLSASRTTPSSLERFNEQTGFGGTAVQPYDEEDEDIL